QSLTEVKSIADKSNMKSIINGINASGSTNIGGGLNAGLNDLISNNYRKGSGAIILLSDGEHNTGTHPNSVIPALQREGIPVFTIGVGSGTDIALMQSIAQQTGGEFYYASKPSNINIIYKTIKNRLNMFDRLTKYINDLLDSAEMSSEIVYVDSSMKQVKFTISTEDAANVSFTLKSPDGKIYSPDNTHDATYVMEDTYQIYFVDNPVPGAWEYEIENNSQRQLEISFDLSGNTSLMLQGSTDTNIYEYPTPMKVIALLHKNGIPIVDANVYATITMPDNTQVELELNDYGIMGDEMPGDGLYTGVFTDFKADGEYEITIHANNDDMQAVLGESFPGLSPDGTISASNQVPIDEKFSRTEILPTVSVSGTSKEISIVQLSTDILEMDEQNNIATVNVTRTGNINGEMSVDYKTSDLTAVEDIDYIPVNGTLHFESGEASKSFEVELLQVPSRNEYYIKEFNVTLNNPINSVLGVPESARVDIYRTEYSNNANLRSLEVDSGTLDKEFSPDVTNYSISVPYETSTVSVKASVSDRWSSMTINGNRVLSGQPSADINLETGVNKIPIVVTAEDEVTQKTYTLTVNRAASSSTNTRPRPNRPAPTPTPESTPTPEPTSTPEPIEKPDDVVPGIILSDAEGHWAEAFIKDLMEKEIVNSYPDGTVRPDEQITRAEAVMLLVKSLNLKAKNPDNIDFIDGSDIPLWVKEAVSAAQENNIIEGFEDKSFRANEKLTRNQACTIVMKAFKHGTSDGETIFDDNDHIASWAKGFVKRANELGIVKGYENNVFMPEKQVTRAEFMTMISKLLHLREEE
ncbi:MAG: VWA domain-containing protein, partial [Clostridiales bacterium]|nr:VWA domain-containing protein [Clostridiales bacterium]